MLVKLMPVYNVKALLNIWPTIIEDVEKILTFSTGDSSLAKIFNELYAGQLLLWVGFLNGKYCGFITTQIYETPFKDNKNKKAKTLWLPHAFIKRGFDKNIFMSSLSEIKRFAIKQQCNTLRFWSVRDKAFYKRMKPLGWRQGYQEFIYDIKQGDADE